MPLKEYLGCGAEQKDAAAIVEALVEVLLSPSQLSQRCAYCGAWEYSDDDTRHQKVGKVKNNMDLYWCGVSQLNIISSDDYIEETKSTEGMQPTTGAVETPVYLVEGPK